MNTIEFNAYSNADFPIFFSELDQIGFFEWLIIILPTHFVWLV